MKLPKVNGFLLSVLTLLPAQAGAGISGSSWRRRTLAVRPLTRSVALLVGVIACCAVGVMLRFGANLYPSVRVIGHRLIVISSFPVWGAVIGTAFGALIWIVASVFLCVPYVCDLCSYEHWLSGNQRQHWKDRMVPAQPARSRRSRTGGSNEE